MKRLHLHVAVEDLGQSIRFYETLFGAPPSVLKPDYAKWMLEDPRVNLAISQRGGASFGVDHVGVQTDTSEELAELSARLKAAGETTFDEAGANCCYAKSDKTWVADPSGLKWETFHTFGEITTYGEDVGPTLKAEAAASACCGAPAGEPAPARSCGCAAA
ncbi:ArsI/CadI family heavy metal resistance metalloenzyme [Phenylobacterium terrae]|uniref:ArsI/CadI family heavy metal resistance metalloenzyme n=1 Tax=Phenylobacterium terrae TaxID=2665495 RepID=A0ABW4N6A8_9CAUL